MSSLAEQHAADPSSAQYWADRARRLDHPDRPAIFYEHLEDGSFLQVTVADGEVTIAPGVGYDDARAQEASGG